MDSGSRDLQVETVTKESISLEDSMVKEDMCGQMVHLTMEILSKDVEKGEASGNPQRKIVIYTSESTKTIRKMAEASTIGQMVANILDIFAMTLSKIYIYSF